MQRIGKPVMQPRGANTLFSPGRGLHNDSIYIYIYMTHVFNIIYIIYIYLENKAQACSC